MSFLILTIHAASTWAMVGVIWFVQLIHYPLFAAVGPDAFVAYERAHVRATSFVVMPLMLVELATAVTLGWLRPPQVGSVWVLAGLGLLVAIWASTFFIQVPLHAALETSFSSEAHRKLVLSNWIRTLAWTARGIVALVMLMEACGSAGGRS